MNPLNKIGEGIKEQDWDLVCEGYNAMTGHDLSVSTKPDNFILEVPWNESTMRLFKQCLHQMIDEFVEFVPEDHAAETCNVLQPTNNDDIEQPEENDEENVDFKEVTSEGDGVGLYGNKAVLITEKPTAKQVKINKKRAADRETPRVSRPPPKTYEVECTDCERTFDSPVRSGEFGQKCSKCLKSTNRER